MRYFATDIKNGVRVNVMNSQGVIIFNTVVKNIEDACKLIDGLRWEYSNGMYEGSK